MIAKAEEKREEKEAKEEEQRAANARRAEEERISGVFYPELEGNKLFRSTFNSVKRGFIAKWVKKIPVKLFTIRVTYGTGDEKLITKDSDEANDKWWETGHYWKLMSSSDITIFGYEGKLKKWKKNHVARMELIKQVKVTGNPGVQRMRDGEKHCIFDKLKTFFLHKLENTESEKKIKEFGYCMRKCDALAKKYDGGVTLDELEQEIKCLQLTVYVYRIDNSIKRILNPRGNYRYNFLNNRFNHCETLLSDTATEELTLIQMNNKVDALLDSNSEFRYEQGKTFVKRIMATDKAYKLKMPYDNLFNEFNTVIEREFFDIDSIKEKQLFEYIQQAGNQNTHMRVSNSVDGVKLKEVDCKAGYTQFKRAPVYKGFLGCVWDFCGAVPLETVFKQIGIYTVQVTDVHRRYACHFQIGKTYTLTSPMIEFLSSPPQQSIQDYGIVNKDTKK